MKEVKNEKQLYPMLTTRDGFDGSHQGDKVHRFRCICVGSVSVSRDFCSSLPHFPWLQPNKGKEREVFFFFLTGQSNMFLRAVLYLPVTGVLEITS